MVVLGWKFGGYVLLHSHCFQGVIFCLLCKGHKNNHAVYLKLHCCSVTCLRGMQSLPRQQQTSWLVNYLHLPLSFSSFTVDQFLKTPRPQLNSLGCNYVVAMSWRGSSTWYCYHKIIDIHNQLHLQRIQAEIKQKKTWTNWQVKPLRINVDTVSRVFMELGIHFFLLLYSRKRNHIFFLHFKPNFSEGEYIRETKVAFSLYITKIFFQIINQDQPMVHQRAKAAFVMHPSSWEFWN